MEKTDNHSFYETKISPLGDVSLIEKLVDEAESFFNSKNDPHQIPMTMDTMRKVCELGSNNIYVYEVSESLVGFSVIVPTTEKNKHDFIDGVINERELCNSAFSERGADVESFYMLLVYVMPAFRQKGFAYDLVKKHVSALVETYKIDNFFGWSYSEGGRIILDKLKDSYNISVH